MKLDLKGLSGKKVLGVPVLYLGVLFVGVLVFFAWRMKPVTDPADAEDDASGSGDGSADVSGDPDYSALATNGTVTVVQPGQPDAVTPVGNMTNDRWIAQGVAYLIAQGTATGGDAQLALSTYVNGGQLTYTQGQYRDAVIKQYGLPPELTTPGGTDSPAAKRQGDPPTVHTVQGKNDNGYGVLERLYYGRSDNDTFDMLQVANPKLGQGGPFAVGTKIIIPAYHSPSYYTATKTTRTLAAIASKNGTSQAAVAEYNDGMKFPVNVGTRVRVK